MRRLAIADQLCWLPVLDNTTKNDPSCWRAAQAASQRDRAQDRIRAERALVYRRMREEQIRIRQERSTTPSSAPSAANS